MYGLICDLNKSGITIIMISHDVSAALKYASHILHVGKVIFFGTKAEYLSSPEGKAFLTQQEGGDVK
jgi:zinc transport system ATP-binding protein